MITLTITRTSLSLADLVITSTPGGDFWIPEDGLEEPGFDYRYTYAPPSRYVSGNELLAAVQEASTLPLPIYTQADTAAALRTNKQALIAALGQFSYEVTLLVDGQGDTYSCDPTYPIFGTLDSGMVRAHMARASCTIPVNPPGV